MKETFIKGGKKRNGRFFMNHTLGPCINGHFTFHIDGRVTLGRLQEWIIGLGVFPRRRGWTQRLDRDGSISGLGGHSIPRFVTEAIMPIHIIPLDLGLDGGRQWRMKELRSATTTGFHVLQNQNEFFSDACWTTKAGQQSIKINELKPGSPHSNGIGTKKATDKITDWVIEWLVSSW